MNINQIQKIHGDQKLLKKLEQRQTENINTFQQCWNIFLIKNQFKTIFTIKKSKTIFQFLELHQSHE